MTVLVEKPVSTLAPPVNRTLLAVRELNVSFAVGAGRHKKINDVVKNVSLELFGRPLLGDRG